MIHVDPDAGAGKAVIILGAMSLGVRLYFKCLGLTARSEVWAGRPRRG